MSMADVVRRGYRVYAVSLNDCELCHDAPSMITVCSVTGLYMCHFEFVSLTVLRLLRVVDLGTFIARSIAGWSPSA